MIAVLLSLGLLLIALLNTQPILAHGHHEFHGNGDSGHQQWHHQHRQHHHQMNDHYPEEAYHGGYPSHDRGQQPYFEGRGVAGGPSTGFGGQMPVTGFGVQQDNGYGRQQVQRPGEHFGGQPPIAYGQEQRRGPWGVPRPFQAGQAPPFQQPYHPAMPPQTSEFRFPEHTRHLQPHPWEGSADLGVYQESGNGINPLGNPQEATEAHFHSSGNAGDHPHTGQRERNPISSQQPSNGWQLNNPIQPRPQANGQDSQLQTFGTADSTLQPRPQQATSGNPEDTKFKFPSSGNTDNNPQQLHAGQTATDTTGFQQPALGQQSGSAIQPRPNESADHRMQSGNPVQPSLDNSSNVEIQQPNAQRIQPLPQSFGEIGLQKPNEEHGSAMTLQPLPVPGSAHQATDSTIDDNIASIFNTHSYMSPSLTEIAKAQRSQDPESIGQRNLFETTPQCKDGMELRGGRCRSKA